MVIRKNNNELAGHRSRYSVATKIEVRFELTRSEHDVPLVRTFYGHDRITGGRVLVKAIDTDGLNRGTRARMEFEAGVRQAHHHQHLSPVTCIVRADNELYVVMPWIEGKPLRQVLDHRTLTIAETLSISKNLFSALANLHSHGVLHRDVTPSNIIIAAASESFDQLTDSKLIGFGTVKRFHPHQLFRDRESEIVSCMSPEEAGSIDADVGPASDLYGAGVVMFRCLTGRLPFQGCSAGEILFEHVSSPVPDLQSINPDVPRELNELVQRLLRKSPHDRYQLATAVVADLQAIENSLSPQSAGPPVVIGSQDRRCTLTEPAFVARDEELSRLTALIASTQTGNGGTILVEGESGCGKTRLLIEAAKHAKRNRLWVVRGQATTQVGQSPYRMLQGIVDGFLALAQKDATLVEDVKRQVGEMADALVAALPSLRMVLAPGSSQLKAPDAFGENRTIESLIRFLNALGSDVRPTVVILDDCQWADQVTYNLIRRWHNQPRSQSRFCSLIISFRTEEVDEHHVLRSMSQSLSEMGPEPLRRGRKTSPIDSPPKGQPPFRTGSECHQIKLEPLGQEEIKRLVESMAGALPVSAIELVTRLADGSPFLATAVLRGLVESGALIVEQGTWVVVPLALADLQSSHEAVSLLTRRIELLPDATLRLLSIGAIVGKDFNLDIAVSLARMTIAEVVKAFQHARDRALIWERADGGQFVFVHDLIRSSLINRLTPAEQADLHLRAASYLQRFNSSRDSEIAFHLDRAGASEAAFKYAMRAAVQARSQFSLEIAEQQYQIARRGATNQPRSVQFIIAEGLGDSMMLRGHYAEAAPELEAAAELAEGELARAKIQSKLAELSFKRGDMENATTGFETALKTLGCFVPKRRCVIVFLLLYEACRQFLHSSYPTLMLNRRRRLPNDSERLSIRLFSLLAHGCWYCRSKEQCLLAHLRGLNLGESFQPTAELAHIYSDHAPVVSLVPLFRRAFRYAQWSLDLRNEFNDVWGQGQSLNYYSCALYAAGRYRECIKKGREAIRLLERSGDYWQVHIARYQVAASLYHLGDFHAAVAEAKINHRSGIELGDKQASSINLDVWARASAGDLTEEVIDIELARDRQDAQGQTQLLLAVGIRAIHRGDLATAIEFLESAGEVVRTARVQNAYTIPCMAWLATAYRMQAEATEPHAPKQRQRLLVQAAKAARKAKRLSYWCPNDLPRATREAALIASMQGNTRQSRRFFDYSLRVAQKLEAVHEQALTLHHRGQVGRCVGWTDAGDDEMHSQRLLDSLDPPHESRPNFDIGELGTLSLVDRFDSVLRVGRQIASALSTDKIYEQIRLGAMRLLRGDNGLLLDLDCQDEPTPLNFAFGVPTIGYNKQRLHLTLKAGRAMAFAEVGNESNADEIRDSHRSSIYVPIYVRSRLNACLCVTHSQVAGLFGPDEERIADFIATIAGAALENAAGFSQLTQLNTTLEQRVQERTLAAEIRAAELASSNERLEQTANVLRAAEEHLRVAIVTAEAANDAKSRFLATMSHEIRTPLNGILGMAELMLRTSLTNQQRHCLTVMNQSGLALLSLLNDVLDISKIEAGKMDLEIIRMSPHDVISQAVKLLAVNAASKSVELINRIAPDVPLEIDCDPCRLRQIIVNLVGNAIKFTDRGEVFVDTSIERRDSGNLLHVSVRDTGPGISQAKQQTIFGSFEQGDSSTTRRYGGTGLGLSISAQLISLLEGTLWVQSELNQGSTFHFTLPLGDLVDNTMMRMPRHLKTLGSLQGYRILIASDRSSTYKVLREILSDAGADCESLDIEQLPEVLIEHAMSDSPHRVHLLLDWDASSSRLADQLTNSYLPLLREVPHLLLIPATGVPTSFHANESPTLTKPCCGEELVAAVRATFEGNQVPRVPVGEIHLPSNAGLHVLIADDAPVNQEVGMGLIEILGHSGEVACNGREAVTAVMRRGFDVVLMDLDMPEMDGTEATHQIRKWEAEHGGHVRIIAMTAHAMTGVKEQCLAAGMDGYLTKPIQPEFLRDILTEIPRSPVQ